MSLILPFSIMIKFQNVLLIYHCFETEINSVEAKVFAICLEIFFKQQTISKLRKFDPCGTPYVIIF